MGEEGGRRGLGSPAAAPRRACCVPRLVAVIVAVAAPCAFAQVTLPPIDPTLRSGEPPPLERERPLRPEPPPLTPPPVAPKLEAPPLPSVRVFVREFRFEGNTVFSDEELAGMMAPYVNREVTTEDLEAARVALTLHYVNKGFVTSGALVPDQEVVDGVITIHIIEGKLARIEIDGEENIWPYYYRSRLALAAGPPVNVNALQERLQLLQQDPRLARVNAELRPAAVRGESDLQVKVAENRPIHFFSEFNNYQAPSIGAERGLATFTHQSLTGNADIFSFTYGRSEGLDLLVDTFYTVPITPSDTTFTGTLRRNDFHVVEDPFEPLNIQSESEIVGFTLRHPFYRTLSQTFSLAVTGEYLYNKTFLLGQPFDFTPGYQDGVAIVNALRIAPEWVYRTASSVVAVRSRFSVGLDVLNATINADPNLPDGQFFAWLGQAQAVRRFERYWGTQVIGRFDIQLANDRLFPLEEIPVGGRYTVRGYRENTFVRDNAIVASVEVRVPVVRSASGVDIVQLAPFVEYGSAWNSRNVPLPGENPRGFIASVGLGVRWNILPEDRARFEIYWGQKLNYIDQGNGNLQDNGIHLGLVVQAF